MEKQEVDAEGDGVGLIQRYAAHNPSEHGQASQYYNSPVQDGSVEADVGQQNGHEEDHQQSEYQETEINGSMEGQQQATPQEQAEDESTEPQHGGHQSVSVSAEELQLAAQLSQGLAPMMEGQAGAEGEPNGLAAHESGMHEHGHDLEGQDQQVHAQQEADYESQDHTMDDQESNPHQEYVNLEDQAQHYAEHAQHHMHHMPMGHLSNSQDNIPPRKRSKVSRACDECRRKKVKCDASPDSGEDTCCSNCRRSQMRCMFSRVPQKRGPSKGYIKELAERINSIEGKLGGQAAADILENASRRELVEIYGAGAGQLLNENSKRPFSHITRDGDGQQQTTGSRASYTPNNLVPPPQVPAVEGQPEVPPEALAQLEVPAPALSDELRDLEPVIFHGYFNIIHPILPILPATREKLQSDIRFCDVPLHNALVEAVSSAVQSFYPGLARNSNPQGALISLLQWKGENPSPGFREGRIFLQTLVLLAIAAENFLVLPGCVSGLSRAFFLSQAVTAAYAIGLRDVQVGARVDVDRDPDNSLALGIRTWWALVCLDRWESLGSGKPLLIPQESVVLTREMKKILGESAYQFTKLSYLLGPLTSGLMQAPSRTLQISPAAMVVFSARNTSALEMWRLDLPETMTSISHPIVHLAYWHCRLLDYLMNPAALSSDVLWASKEAVNMLVSSHQMISPFNTHFAALAAVCLGELAKVERHRDETMQFIRTDFIEARMAQTTWDDLIRENLADSLRSSTAQNLQQLADLATATGRSAAAAAAAAATTAAAAVNGSSDEETSVAGTVTEEPDDLVHDVVFARGQGDYENMGFDPRPMLRGGYLNTLRVVA